MKNALLFFSFVLTTGFLQAQELFVGDVSGYPKNMVNVSVDANGDTMANISLYTCVISAEKHFTSPKDLARWTRLKADVKAAYPYAVLAKMKLAEMDSQLVAVKGDRARKDFTDKCE